MATASARQWEGLPYLVNEMALLPEIRRLSEGIPTEDDGVIPMLAASGSAIKTGPRPDRGRTTPIGTGLAAPQDARRAGVNSP